MYSNSSRAFDQRMNKSWHITNITSDGKFRYKCVFHDSENEHTIAVNSLLGHKLRDDLLQFDNVTAQFLR